MLDEHLVISGPQAGGLCFYHPFRYSPALLGTVVPPSLSFHPDGA